jgi:hypothetical protein
MINTDKLVIQMPRLIFTTILVNDKRSIYFIINLIQLKYCTTPSRMIICRAPTGFNALPKGARNDHHDLSRGRNLNRRPSARNPRASALDRSATRPVKNILFNICVDRLFSFLSNSSKDVFVRVFLKLTRYFFYTDFRELINVTISLT